MANLKVSSRVSQLRRSIAAVGNHTQKSPTKTLRSLPEELQIIIKREAQELSRASYERERDRLVIIAAEALANGLDPAKAVMAVLSDFTSNYAPIRTRTREPEQNPGVTTPRKPQGFNGRE